MNSTDKLNCCWRFMLMAGVIVFCSMLVGCAKPVAPEKPLARPIDRAWDARADFHAGLTQEGQSTLDQAALTGASVYHIDLHISEDKVRLNGHEQVWYTNRENVPLDEIYFRLFPNIFGGEAAVSEVKIMLDGQETAITPDYELAKSAIRLDLPTPLQPGEQIIIQMMFEVNVPEEMAGNYGLFGYFDDVLVLNEFYPVIPVYDDEGWNVEVPPPHGDVTYFDASFYRVRVTAPADLVIITSGVTTERTAVDQTQTSIITAGPARDFYLAASDAYIVINEQVDDLHVNSYVLPGYDEGAALALRFAKDALQSFSELFGPYPYTEFDIASTPMQALGMEYPGMTVINITLYDPDAEISGVPAPAMLEATVVHEVAHQWFYNVVGNDQVDEPWVDEALVQYASWRYYVAQYGETAARGYHQSWEQRWDRVDRAEIPIGLPVRCYDGKEYGAIVYGRGPLFIEALAEEMGQATFDAFLRDYYISQQWEIGTAEEFKQLAEEHCACDLTPLFETWVY